MTRRNYMTINEAAEHLRVSYHTVYKHIRNGNIPATRKRRVYLIPVVEIEKFKCERDAEAEYDRRRAIRG